MLGYNTIRIIIIVHVRSIVVCNKIIFLISITNHNASIVHCLCINNASIVAKTALGVRANSLSRALTAIDNETHNTIVMRRH